jgi:outer membrane immunogenic protein
MRAIDRLGRYLRCGLLASGLLVAGIAGALADGGAGRPHEPAAVRWEGIYAGVHAGIARSDTDWRYQNDNYFNTLGPVVVGTDFDLGTTGAIGGAQIGFNHQAGPWVYGIEATAAVPRLDERQASPLFPDIDTNEIQVHWLATLTGYAKAGWAGADLELTVRDRVALIDASASTWVNGWTVGAGVEYLLRPGFSVGVAYDHVRLNVDGWTIACPLCGTGVGAGTPIVDGDIVIHTLTARLNYRFGN